MLSPGQAGDNPYLAPPLEAHRTHDTRSFRLLADKAYSHPNTRKHLRKRRIAHTIPERADQKERRKAKGQKVVARPRSTRTATANAIPSSAASAVSINGAASQPATTSTPSLTTVAYL